jgi:copper resistance protein D
MELLAIVRGLQIGGTLLLAGALAFELLVLRRASWSSYPLAAPRVGRWLRLLRVTGVIVGLLSWLVWLAVLAIEMSGLPAAEALTPPVLWKVLTRTTFGHAWSIRLILFVVTAAQLASSRSAALERPRFDRWLGAAVSVGLVVGLAWTGHAVGTHPTHVAVDAVHLIAAAIWLGMIPPLWLVVRRANTSGDWSGLAIASAHHFFWPGVVSVAVVAASGLANATWLLDSVTDLWTTRYGILLLAKVGLFVLMVMLAIFNRGLTRRARGLGAGVQQPVLRLLRDMMRLELLCGTLVLAIVALLGITPPATHEHAMHQVEHHH